MKTTAAVIDFGTSKIVTVLAESGSFSRCEIIGSGTVPYTGFMDGSWLEPIEIAEKVKQSVSAAELEAKTHVKEIFVSVPSEYINIRMADAEIAVSAEDGRITEEDMDAVQDAAADSLGFGKEPGCVIHRSPAWFMVDGGKKTMTPIQTAKRGKSLRALTSFVVADPAFVSEMRELFRTMGVQVRGFVSPAFGQAILYIPSEERDKTAALLDVGYLNTEFSVVEGDAIVYHAVLPIGGGLITADIAENLSISMASAEKLKREFSLVTDELENTPDYSVTEPSGRITFPGEFVSRAVKGTLGELTADIGGAIREAGSALGSRSPIYVTGGGLAPMRGAKQFLSETLEYTVREARAQSGKLGGFRYTSALGMIDQAFDSLEVRTVQGDTLPGRLAGGVKNLFRRADKEDNTQTDTDKPGNEETENQN